ncbi:putative aromatic aminotransferase Aro8 [Aureobasidium pullulans]|uniref:Putative aromatic aminotransferase Aro8 n=1 Tax=Aureobasidium pullulans TaxID=5580 RepID=A0A4S8VI02_AURPU|nr:putative aromatic aminotransferase Aro8 [Aureobasidium pullulans]
MTETQTHHTPTLVGTHLAPARDAKRGPLVNRRTSPPLPLGVAVGAPSENFKTLSTDGKHPARRWDHILSSESRGRKPSNLKGTSKYLKPGVLNLCGGVPSSEYFPFSAISTVSPTASDILPYSSQKPSIQTITKHDVADETSEYDLNIALNYGPTLGAAQVLRFVTEHVELLHDPPYSDWTVSLSIGSTSALDIAFRMFCERGTYVLAEKFTFSSTVQLAGALGAKLLGVEVDDEGMIPESLDAILNDWDPAYYDGAPKPFLLYTIPSGQNPTATTQSLKRRKAIYAVAEKHDLFLLEDDPYYYLQMNPFTGSTEYNPPSEPPSFEQYKSGLVPSFLSLDISGRVLRIDTFSKIIAPGARVGWVTGPAQIIERYQRQAEFGTQAPSGFSLLALYNILEKEWGHEGFFNWLAYLRASYTHRRDVMVKACYDHLPKQVASFTVPSAGMFQWICVDVVNHPKTDQKHQDHAVRQQNLLDVEHSIFEAATKEQVLVAKGSFFKTALYKGGPVDDGVYFRMTFAAAPKDQIEEAVRRFGAAIRAEFGLM